MFSLTRGSKHYSKGVIIKTLSQISRSTMLVVARRHWKQSFTYNWVKTVVSVFIFLYNTTMFYSLKKKRSNVRDKSSPLPRVL